MSDEKGAAAEGQAARMPSFVLPGAAPPAEIAALRPGMPLRLRRATRESLLIEVETLDGCRLGRLPREDALRLVVAGRTARMARVTGLVPARGHARVLVSLELGAS